MFLLIPALLLAMEVASWASVTVRPPMHTPHTTTTSHAPQDPFRFSVMVRSDGFLAKVGQRGSDDGAATEIPLGSAAEHDYAALEEMAQDLKARFPDQPRVSLSAEGDIPLSTLVETMDALRGRDCSLTAAYTETENPDGCLFWDVVVES